MGEPARQLDADDWAEVLADFPTFCSLLSVETKEAGVATRRFHFEDWFPEQRSLWERSSGRDVVLKSRQVGITTLGLALDLWTAVQPGNNVLIAVHQDGENRLAKTLLRALKLMAESLAETPLLPLADHDNEYEWTFPEIRSSLRVLVVKRTEDLAGEIGRGVTVHRFHGSEVASWGKGDGAAWSAIEGSLAPGAPVLLESTAKGYGNLFHRVYEGAPRNGFRAHFWPWYRHPAYALDFNEQRPPSPRTDLERELVEEHGLSLRQLAWWQAKVASRPGGEQGALQEYPPDPARAFLTSGASFFGNEVLESIAGDVRGPLGYCPEMFVNRVHQHRLLLKLQRDGSLVVYRRPKERSAAAIGADPAEGVGRDESAAVGFDRLGHLLFRLNAQLPPDVFADALVELALFYRGAVVAVERNNHGHRVLGRLEERLPGCLFPPVALTPEESRERWPWHDGRAGFLSNQRTRPLVLDTFEEAVRTGAVDVVDPVLQSQMRTFVRNERGKPEALNKGGSKGACLDDVVLAAAIAWFIRGQALPSRAPPKKRDASEPREQERRRRRRGIDRVASIV